MKNVTLLLVFTAITFNMEAQPPFYWAKTGDTTYKDYCQKMVTDANGNIYAGGSASYRGKSIGEIIKYDQVGNNLWLVTDTGAGLGVYINDLCLDSKNDLYVAGQQYNPGTAMDAYISKYSSNGQLLWKKYYNGTADSTDGAASITYFNSYMYIAGATVGLQNQSRVLLQKYDTAGNLKWTVSDSMNRLWNNSASCVAHDSTYLIVTGIAQLSMYEWKMFLAKYDQAGNKIWQTFDSLSDLEVSGGTIVTDHYQNIYVAIGGSAQYNLVKYDTLGYFMWGYRITPFLVDAPPGIADIKLDENDNIYLSGTASIAGGFDGESAFLFTKLRSNGSVAGTYVGQVYGYAGSFDFLSQNDMVVEGSLDSLGLAIVDFDSAVNIKWKHYYTNDVPSANCGLVVVDSMKNILLAGGGSLAQGTGYSIEVIKYGSTPFATALNNLNGEPADMKIFPNPGAPGNVQCVVSDNLVGNNLQMFDLTGRLLQQMKITDTSFKLPTTNLNNGIYFFRVCAVSGVMAVGRLELE